MKIRVRGKNIIIKPASMALLGLAAVLIVSLCVRFASQHSSAQPAASASASIISDEDYDASAGVLDVSQYGNTVLALTEDAGQDYVDSTLFLGDSNTARFMRILDPDTEETFTGKENTIGVVGMGIDAISTLECMEFSTGLYTMPEAVQILQPERVIITFGTNNLYGSSTDATSFIARYEKQIQAIVDAYPSVDIIVNSIPPVAQKRSYPNVTMTQIDAYNKAIAQMCQDNDWKYLNSAEALKDEETGFARNGYMAGDGLHLAQEGLQALFACIRTHACITEDDRPKPLADIPTIIGVPDGLIQINPLTDSEFTEDVSTSDNAQENASTPTATATASSTPSASPIVTPTATATASPTPATSPTVSPTAEATTAAPETSAPATSAAAETATPSPTAAPTTEAPAATDPPAAATETPAATTAAAESIAEQEEVQTTEEEVTE